MINYQATQSILLDILSSTQAARMHLLILSIKQLKDELTKIHENIPKTLLIPGERHHESILQLYKILIPRARVTKKNIVIEISLPLLYNEEFKLYKVLPVPTKHNGYFASIIPSSQFLMVNLQGHHFYQLQEKEFQQCKIRPFNIYWCPLQHPLHTTGVSISACEINILQHKPTMNACKIKQLPSRLTWTEMHQKNAWIYSTPEPITVNVNCDFNTAPIILQGSGLLKLPARCIIHDQDMTIVGRQTMISRLNSSFLPSFNLSEMIASQNFKNEEQSILSSSSSLDLFTLERSLKRDHEHLLKLIKTHRTY